MLLPRIESYHVLSDKLENAFYNSTKKRSDHCVNDPCFHFWVLMPIPMENHFLLHKKTSASRLSMSHMCWGVEECSLRECHHRLLSIHPSTQLHLCLINAHVSLYSQLFWTGAADDMSYDVMWAFHSWQINRPANTLMAFLLMTWHEIS